MPVLRPYQRRAEVAIYEAWARGATNVLAVLPTGAGKTVTFSDVVQHQNHPDSLFRDFPEVAQRVSHILGRHGEPACVIAHRQELVGQVCTALARNGVKYRIIAPRATIRRLVREQIRETGTSHYDPNAQTAVAGVDTLIRQRDKLAAWCDRVKLWVIDEAHHVLVGNKWGSAVAMFPNARGLGVTATPVRADGKGLGAHSDGVFHDMVVGPSPRDLINEGWLTDYRIFAPQSDIDLSEVNHSADGDFNRQQLKKAIRKSHIVGDVVQHYQRIAPGRLGVVFASDIETATDISQRFNAAGVKAEVVTGKTDDRVRGEILRRFRAREIDVLVNVDLFGEGFDLPAIEVVIFARPTESFALYCQQFGRALRLMLDGVDLARFDMDTPEGRRAAIAASAKPRAIVIDHVGNVVRHGLPDAPRAWSLDGREKRSRDKPDDAIPLMQCLNVECMQVYERIHPRCPYCSAKPTPAGRSAPEQVDGDLTELDAETLARMRGEVAQVDKSPEQYRVELERSGCPGVGVLANVKRHAARQEAQAALRASMNWWAGHHKAQGRDDAESYRRFWFAFGVDAMSAQALGTDEALDLAHRINLQLVDMLGTTSAGQSPDER